jgi:carbon storage regulator CsrA
MLKLTRREGEALILTTSDGEIVVSLERLSGSQVKLGIEAPKSVRVLRGELLGSIEDSESIVR